MEVNKLNIIIERHVPFLAGLLEPYANVRYIDAADINIEKMRPTDALITRTRTQCNRELLELSRCSFIGTATIGTDHIDTDYCRSRHIAVVNAPGCNAPAVAQYVMASIACLVNRPLSQYTLGIVGVGHVGSIVQRWARAWDMKVLAYDPPRQAAEGGDGWVDSLDELAARCDIITFHVPLVHEGEYATYHMADADFFGKLRRSPILINTARGAVVDTPALIDALDEGKVSKAVIDCWEGEPDIDTGLLSRAAIATPHIAGYSHEGKVRASQMVLDALTNFFTLPRISLSTTVNMTVPQTVRVMDVVQSYDPLADTARLKADPAAFEQLRDTYRYRSEVKGGRVTG